MTLSKVEWVKVCHSRMVLAGIQAKFGLAPRLKHSGVTTREKVIRGPLDTPLLAAGFFILDVARPSDYQFILDAVSPVSHRPMRYR